MSRGFMPGFLAALLAVIFWGVQLPVAHEGVVFARPEHGTPHAPQSVSVRVDTHMTPAPESQSMRPIEPSQPVA